MSIKKNFFTVLLLSLFYLLLSTYSYAKVTTLTATSTVISDQGILPISAKTDVIKLTIVEGDPVEDSSSFTKAVVSLSSAAYISNVYLYRDDGSGVFGSGDSKVAEERVSTSSVVTLEGFSESITNQTKTYFIVIETSERIRNNYEFNVTLSSVTVSNLGDGVSFSPVTTTNIRCVDWVGDVTADADYIYAIDQNIDYPFDFPNYPSYSYTQPESLKRIANVSIPEVIPAESDPVPVLGLELAGKGILSSIKLNFTSINRSHNDYFIDTGDGTFDPATEEHYYDFDGDGVYDNGECLNSTTPSLSAGDFYSRIKNIKGVRKVNADDDYWGDDPLGTPGVYDPGIDEIFLDNDGDGEYSPQDTVLYQGATPGIQTQMRYADDDGDGQIDEEKLDGKNDDNDYWVDENSSGSYEAGLDEIYYDYDDDGVYEDAADTRIDTDGWDSPWKGSSEDSISAGAILSTFDSGDSPIKVFDEDNDGRFDEGVDDIFYDANLNDVYDADTDLIILQNGALLGTVKEIQFTNLVYYDSNEDGSYTSGEDIILENVEGKKRWTPQAEGIKEGETPGYSLTRGDTYTNALIDEDIAYSPIFPLVDEELPNGEDDDGDQQHAFIIDGGNGVAESVAQEDDDQNIPPNQSVLPGQPIITAGPNGIIDTAPGGDDQIQYNADRNNDGVFDELDEPYIGLDEDLGDTNFILPEDIDSVTLWQDNGDGVFDPSTDSDVTLVTISSDTGPIYTATLYLYPDVTLPTTDGGNIDFWITVSTDGDDYGADDPGISAGDDFTVSVAYGGISITPLDDGIGNSAGSGGGIPHISSIGDSGYPNEGIQITKPIYPILHMNDLICANGYSEGLYTYKHNYIPLPLFLDSMGGDPDAVGGYHESNPFLDASSQPVPVIGINLVDGAEGTMDADLTFDAIRINFQDLSGADGQDTPFFNPQIDLTTLSDDENSGVAIYKDNPTAGIQGVFDSQDTLVEVKRVHLWNHNLDDTPTPNDPVVAAGGYYVWLEFLDGQEIPNDDTSSQNKGHDYFVIIRTSEWIDYRDAFRVYIRDGDINIKNKPSANVENSCISTDTIYGKVPVSLSKLTYSGQEIPAQSTLIPIIGLSIHDENNVRVDGSPTKLKRITLWFQNVGEDTDFTSEDLAALNYGNNGEDDDGDGLTDTDGGDTDEEWLCGVTLWKDMPNSDHRGEFDSPLDPNVINPDKVIRIDNKSWHGYAGFPYTCVLDGIQDSIDADSSVLPTDDGPVIVDGGNGVVDTEAEGDDVQLIPVEDDQGNPVTCEPGATIIAAGANGVIDTTVSGDDQEVSSNNLGSDYFIVIRTSSTINSGDDFTVSISPKWNTDYNYLVQPIEFTPNPNGAPDDWRDIYVSESAESITTDTLTGSSVVLTSYENMVETGQRIENESFPTAVIGINVADGGLDQLLNSVKVYFSGTNFSPPQDLAPLTQDKFSGVALYKDADGNGTFDEDTDTLVDIQRPLWANDADGDYVNLVAESGQDVPDDDTGDDDGPDYFIVIRTSNDLQYRDTIQATIKRDAIIFTSGTSNANSDLTTNALTANVRSFIIDETSSFAQTVVPNYGDDPGETPYAIIGLNLTDGTEGDTGTTFNSISIKFNNISGFTTADLQPLSTDSSVSGVALYIDNGSVEGVFDSDDTDTDLIAPAWGIQGPNTVTLTPIYPLEIPANDSGIYQGADYHIVIRTAGMTQGDQFQPSIQTGWLKYGNADAEKSLTVSTITCDVTENEPPTIQVTQPPSSGAVFDPNTDTSFTIAWSATDADDDAEITLFYDTNTDRGDGYTQIYPDSGDTPLSENTDSSYEWDETSPTPITSLSSGTYYILAKIDDNFNTPVYDYSDGPLYINYSPQCNSVDVQDTTQPGIARISWDVQDVDDNALIRIYWDSNNSGYDGTFIGSVYEDFTSDYQWDVSELDPGDYYVYIIVDDGVNNPEKSRIYSEDHLTVTNTAPTITLYEPDTLKEHADASYTITWTATDPDNDAQISLYYDSDKSGYDGILIVSGLSENSQTSYEWDTSTLPENEYFVYAVIDDGINAPVQSYAEGSILVEHDDEPSITVTAPPGSGAINNGTEPYTIRWDASDADDTAVITLYYDNNTNPDDGKTRIIGGLEEGIDDSYSWNMYGLASGSYYIYAEINDGTTTASDYSDGTVTLDYAPTISNVAPEVDTIENKKFNIEWTAQDPDDDAQISLYYDEDNSGYNGTLIISGLSEDTTGFYAWYLGDKCNEGGNSPYYIYGVISDGVSEAKAYSLGTLTIRKLALSSEYNSDAQMDIVDGGSAVANAFAPGSENNLVMDFYVYPDGGATTLTALTVANIGGAQSTDLDAVKLWKEDGSTSGFQSDEDNYVAELMWNGSLWVKSGLSEAVSAGSRFYVTVDVSAQGSSNNTLQFEIPQLSDVNKNGEYDSGDEGLFLDSGENGPFEEDFTNSATQWIGDYVEVTDELPEYIALYETMNTDTAYIDAESDPIGVLGININDNGEGLTLDRIELIALGSDNFDPDTDLLELVNSDASGVCLYKDNGDTEGVFDSNDSRVSVTLGNWEESDTGDSWLLYITPTTGQDVPDDDTGDNEGADYFVVVRTSKGLEYKDTFNFKIETGGVTLTGKTGPAVAVTTRVLQSTVPTFYTDLTSSGQEIIPGERLAVIGIEAYDSSSVSDVRLKSLKVKVTEGSGFNYLLDLADEGDTGIWVYRDDGDGTFEDDGSDTPLTKDGDPDWSQWPQVTMNFDVSDDNTLVENNKPDTPVFFVVVEGADTMRDGGTFSVQINAEYITYSGSDWYSYKSIATNTLTCRTPELSVAGVPLEFGETVTQRTFTITNTGTGTLVWEVSEDTTWISSINPESGSTTTETDNVSVTVDRTGLEPGNYTDEITVTSNGGNKNIRVSMVVPATDTDGDGIPDWWEEKWGLNPYSEDTDDDGLSDFEEVSYNKNSEDYDPYDPDTKTGTDLNATEKDTDEDGMQDDWEIDNALNPIDETDAEQDPDKDGWTNLEEYNNNSDPNNASPHKPAVVSPRNESTDVRLTPTLEGSVYNDDEGDRHMATQWQIANGTDFSDENLAFDSYTLVYKEQIKVDRGILKPQTTYFWRVRYRDLYGWSRWSDAAQFTTLSYSEAGDSDQDGIPDGQEIDDFVDVDNNGVDDNQQDNIATLKNVVSGEQVAVKTNQGKVTQAQTQSADDYPGKPQGYNFPEGIFSFRIEGLTPDSRRIEVTFYLPQIFTTADKWYKYSESTGWQNYTGRIVSGIGTKQVTLEFKDGDYGDIDGVANGVIVDPSGPAYTLEEEKEEGGGGRSCFIATAAYGTPMHEEVQILQQFRDEYLLTNSLGRSIIHTYYRVSPPVAEFITERPALKKLVRIFLKPVVWTIRKMVR